MKKNSVFSIIALMILLTFGCKKSSTPEPAPAVIPANTAPVLTTASVTSIKQNTATCGGDISSNGGSAVTARGVCWDTLQNPTITHSHTTDSSGSGSFTSKITGLTLGTTYYVRAYATNGVGTTYGAQQTFTTSSTLAIGVTYQGGIIFYLDSTNLHGMICAPSDQTGTLLWLVCGGSTISGANGTAVGTGAQNTKDILNSCSVSGSAAYSCSHLTLNGKTGWFLPSKGELSLMYSNLKVNGLGNFNSTGTYWSSSQYSSGEAWIADFSSGLTEGAGTNIPGILARAARAF